MTTLLLEQNPLFQMKIYFLIFKYQMLFPQNNQEKKLNKK